MGSSTKKRTVVSVIIPIRDNARNTKKLLSLARRIARCTEIIVLCKGASSRAARLSRKMGAEVVQVNPDTDGNKARAIGSNHAKGDILLFMDDRNERPLRTLKKYVKQIIKGADVVVTPCSHDASLHAGKRSSREAYCLLNHLLGKEDMGSASFENLPFAINRHALEVITFEHLCVPAIAMLQASLNGLAITKIDAPPILKRPTRRRKIERENVQQTIQEHAKAIQILSRGYLHRAANQDGERHRSLVNAPDILHLRSVIHLESREKEGGGWHAKRKVLKKTQGRSS